MNYFELQDFYKQAFPGKQVSFDFDEKCHRTCELIMTDGLPNMVHHVEMNKCKVTVEGLDPVYMPIQAHRMNITWAAMLGIMNGKSSVFIHDQELSELSKLKDRPQIYDLKMSQLKNDSGLSQDQIEAKLKIQ